MQDANKHQANSLQIGKQQYIMLLQEKSHKFHIGHAQNGATVQHIHMKQDITRSYPKTVTWHLVDIETT